MLYLIVDAVWDAFLRYFSGLLFHVNDSACGDKGRAKKCYMESLRLQALLETCRAGGWYSSSPHASSFVSDA